MILVFLLSFFISHADAKTCQSIFADISAPTQFIALSTGRKMNTQLEQIPNSKGNVLLIHGLGDDLTHWNKIAQSFLNDGYSVLRVDLHGHGKTLETLSKIPNLLPYENNVKDISEILKKLKFKNPIIIGHSYGGAIAYSLAKNLKGEYAAKNLVMLAPYLRRLDHAMLTGNPLIDMQTEFLTEQFLRQTYREYFEAQNRKNVDAHVDAAIATTKGIRSFDILSFNTNAALQDKIPLLLVGGKKDELIRKDIIEDFHEKLSKEDYEHSMAFIDGDHFFPHKESDETYKIIILFGNNR